MSRSALALGSLAVLALALQTPAALAQTHRIKVQPRVYNEIAHDLSAPLRSFAGRKRVSGYTADENGVVEIRPENEEPVAPNRPSRPDGALQRTQPRTEAAPGSTNSFEGLSSQDNFNIFGQRFNPPDPVGAVGPNHYVEMVNLTFAVYDRAGNVLVPATAVGALWDGFAVSDCSLNAGDAVVVYDRYSDRWLLSQFTTAETDGNYYNCVAISKTSDPTGAYYRYAFTTAQNFPDYPKYGIWNGSFVITTREFGDAGGYGVGVYALEKKKMLNGKPNARVVSFFLNGDDPNVLPLIGDGLLAAYADGKNEPDKLSPIPIVGTQDDGGGYGATFDALNVFDLSIDWKNPNKASLDLKAQLPVASFDSIFPCSPDARDCLPQPGISNSSQYLDFLGYRQRPTWRLAYRKFGNHETLVTSQSVEATPGMAGMRWYELRRKNGAYSLYQQGTYAPDDGIHRWMGSAAMDRDGSIALGYSVVNGDNVYPGIRYTGRLKGDPKGKMTLAESKIIKGTGVQTTTNSRWGDYTSLNLDPIDDCTFWYVNEYYTLEGQQTSTVAWQTRISNFQLPNCTTQTRAGGVTKRAAVPGVPAPRLERSAALASGPRENER
jgi:hypothetical protein